MKTHKTNIIDFLSEVKVINIPCWHRDFVWDSTVILQLFDDIKSLINSKDNTLHHFFGTIIYKELNTPLFTIQLVDGHQRIAAVGLFLIAIFNYFKNNRYKDLLLHQGNKSNASKLVLPEGFSDCCNLILADEMHAYSSNTPYAQAYRTFVDRIEAYNYNFTDYIEALRRFQIITISLANNDNQQLIFDSVNSVSRKLTKFEKIKNYIFMGLSKADQDKIMSEYWLPIMRLFGDNVDVFIDYLISYVSMQTTDRKVDADNIFYEFNKFYAYKRRYKDAIEIISELFKFSQYYIRIKNADFSKDIATQFEQIISLINSPEIYSFMFELTDDFQNKLISKKAFIDALQTTYDYIKNSIDNNEEIDFTILSQTISKILVQKED